MRPRNLLPAFAPLFVSGVVRAVVPVLVPGVVILASSFSMACATAALPDTSGGDTPDAGQMGGDAATSEDAAPANDASSSSCTAALTGVLATFDFTGATGDQPSTPATTVAAGLTVVAIHRSGSLTAVTGTDSMNASGWSTTAQADTARYYTLTLTPIPSAKCVLDVSSVVIDTAASGSGPSNGSVATSDDAFAAQTTFATGGVRTVKVSVSGATTALELRVYGYGASSTGGTMRVQNTLSVTGALR